jgi:hypothetical protein
MNARAIIICITALLLMPAPATAGGKGLPPGLVYLGAKQFHDREWGEYDTHVMMGMGINYPLGDNNHLYLTNTLLQSFHAREDEEEETEGATGNPSADHKEKSDDMVAVSYELGIGLRAVASIWGIRPYVGAGASIVYGDYEPPDRPGCQGAAVGGWYGYGLLWGKERSYTFGFDWRRTKATSKPECSPDELEVGGTIITLTFGLPLDSMD